MLLRLIFGVDEFGVEKEDLDFEDESTGVTNLEGVSWWLAVFVLLVVADDGKEVGPEAPVGVDSSVAALSLLFRLATIL